VLWVKYVWVSNKSIFFRKAWDDFLDNVEAVVKMTLNIYEKELKKAMRSLDAANSQMVIRDAIFND